MIIHVRDFVYGEDIKHEDKDGKFFVKGCDSIIQLREGDQIIYVNKSPCQAWIETGIITALGVDNMPERIKLDTGVSINVEGECYIGLI